jgi:hypothetical protein
MVETQEKRKLRVSTVPNAGPFVIVQVSQVDSVKELLINHGIDHWVERGSVSLAGRPPTTVINFGRKGDAHPGDPGSGQFG